MCHFSFHLQYKSFSACVHGLRHFGLEFFFFFCWHCSIITDWITCKIRLWEARLTLETNMPNGQIWIDVWYLHFWNWGFNLLVVGRSLPLLSLPCSIWLFIYHYCPLAKPKPSQFKTSQKRSQIFPFINSNQMDILVFFQPLKWSQLKQSIEINCSLLGASRKSHIFLFMQSIVFGVVCWNHPNKLPYIKFEDARA